MECCVWKLDVTAGDGVLGRVIGWTGLGAKAGEGREVSTRQCPKTGLFPIRLRFAAADSAMGRANVQRSGTLFHLSIGTTGLWLLYLGGQARSWGPSLSSKNGSPEVSRTGNSFVTLNSSQKRPWNDKRFRGDRPLGLPSP